MAENEVANAGIGVQIGVKGLQDLIDTNKELVKVRDVANSIHDLTSTINTHVEGLDNVNNLKDKIDSIRDNTANVRVNTQSINSAKGHIDSLDNDIKHLQGSMKSVGDSSGSSFDKLRTHENETREDTNKLVDSGHRIRDVFTGSTLANSVQQGFSYIKNGAISAIKKGSELVITGKQVQQSWKNIGAGNQGAKQMVSQMDDLRDSAGMDKQSIEDLQRRFYVLTGSAPRARALTNEVVAFGKASGESSQRIGRMGRMLPRLLSASKVRATTLNRTLGEDPALFNAIIKASGKSKNSFMALANSGKLTSQELQQWMSKAAKGSSSAMDKYYKSTAGQIQALRGTWQSAQEKFSKPFVNNLTKSINQTEHSAGGLQKIQKSVAQISSELGKKVGNYTGKAIGYLVKNQKPLIQTGKDLFKIVAEIGQGVWKTWAVELKVITFPLRMIGDLLSLIYPRTNKATKGMGALGKTLYYVAKARIPMKILGGVLATVFVASKIRKYTIEIRSVYRWYKRIITSQKLMAHWQKIWNTMQAVWAAIIGPIKAFWAAEKAGVGIQAALDAAMDANPIGAIVVGITAAVGAITAVVLGLHHLYEHCAPARHAMQAIGHVGVMAFKAITFPERMVLKFLGGIVKGVWHATSGLRHKLGHALDRVGSHVKHFYHSATHNASKWGHEAGHAVGSVVNKFTGGSKKEAHASKRTHEAIDRYRHNSAGKFRAYISKSGKIYKKYHKGCTRISETTYKQRRALANNYYRKYAKNLQLYEKKYRKYEHKRSSLSRKYGKIRAMYSAKSLTLIEDRFKRLRNTVVKYAKELFHDTQRIFRKIGTGAGKQFKDIYKAVRKYMRMSNTESKRDFKELYRNSHKWLNGSIMKYVKALRYRYRKQRFYDKQLVKQSKATGKAMYHLPLGWIHRETKDLIRNWSRQRKSYITHNERMTKAERTHLRTMTHHLDTFGDHFRKMMRDLESDIYDAWSKFWTKMHNRAGSGINAVQRPLNSGASHINSFVRAFGEETSPMHEMPEVSYATGTGMRRPITRMVQATLNDGHDSPETNNQETVVHPNGSVEFPQGNNVKETLEPGTEVLNATETRLMGEMAHFAPTVHLATGTGLFGDLFNHMSEWIRNGLEGSNNTDDYSAIWGQAKGSGNHKLLHVLQAILKHSNQVISGFMGNAPSGYHGALDDIVKGIYGQTNNQIDQWWNVLMKLTDQALNNGASSSEILNYAMKHWTGVPYVYGATSNSGADCGGAVQSILRHFGISVPHVDIEDSPNVKYVGKSLSDARPGDLVGFGSKSGSKSGASSHIGIYEHGDTMWSEHPPKSGPESIREAADADGLWGFYRIKNAPSNDKDALNSIKTNNPLGNFVKHQEAPMLKWIEKHLAPLLDPDPGGGPGVAKWRTVVEQAAEKMHVHLTEAGLSKVLRDIGHESNGDESVTNHWDSNAAAGHPSTGLLQFIPSTFEHYAVPGHNNIHSGYDQILAMFNDSSWFSDINPGGGWGPTGSRKMQSGGHVNAGELATVGEQGEELFKPDNAGTIIPHSTTKRILNNNKRPVSINQNITINANGDKTNIKRAVKDGVDKGTDNLMDKLARMSGLNNEGGMLV